MSASSISELRMIVEKTGNDESFLNHLHAEICELERAEIELQRQLQELSNRFVEMSKKHERVITKLFNNLQGVES